jgi:two-component system sensor histidine kinase KdpD
MDWESAEEIVGTVLRRARQRDPSRRVSVRVEHRMPLLYCNAVLLAQLLDNLVDNAMKHCPPDTPIEIDAHCRADRMVIAVEDRGPGVPLPWRSRMFDTFQRIETDPAPGAAETPGRRGAGVGLALCRAIARAHGGEIGYREREGGGSSFEVELPIRKAPDDAREIAAPGPRT